MNTPLRVDYLFLMINETLIDFLKTPVAYISITYIYHWNALYSKDLVSLTFAAGCTI